MSKGCLGSITIIAMMITANIKYPFCVSFPVEGNMEINNTQFLTAKAFSLLGQTKSLTQCCVITDLGLKCC